MPWWFCRRRLSRHGRAPGQEVGLRAVRPQSPCLLRPGSPRHLGGTALSLLHINPIKPPVFVAVIDGVAAAPFLIVVMRVSSSKRIMGDYVNGNAAKIIGWLTAALMAAAAISLFATGGITI
jgi:hypothetical protein